MRAILCLVLVGGALTGCHKALPPPLAEVVVVTAATLPGDPADVAWQSAPEYVAKLLPQDMVEPRLLTPSTAEVRVRAMQNGQDVVFRLEWADPTANDLSAGARFSDACAVQVPATADPSVPAPQMGEPGKPVEVTFWNAGWQAAVDGRADTLKAIYPNAQIDHYPPDAAPLQKDASAQREMAARYSPARALGNAVAGPHTTPVQDLVAEGPGTLSPAKASLSTGSGKRTAAGWAVVIRRPQPADMSGQGRSQIAFAVWQGAQEEVGARKMRTGWVPLVKQGAQ